MSGSHFWRTEAQFERIARHLPTDMRGVARVDDRWVIGGIIQALRSGRRWKDAPATYGPRKTLSNRFVRWTAKGVWSALLQSLS